MEDYKTSRESSKREKLTRKKDWTPPSSLDAPAAPHGMHIDGYVLRLMVLKTQVMCLRN